MSSPIPQYLPTDQDARDLILTDIDHTLFVNAGAGTGKTTNLVGRIFTMVNQGIPITNIAAITFTNKAAAELQIRLRDRLETEIAELEAKTPTGQIGVPQLEVLETALRDLDSAAIGTLDSFAKRILTEYSLEAKVPPAFTVADTFDPATGFTRRWHRIRDLLLDATAPLSATATAATPDPNSDIRQSLERLMGLGITVKYLRETVEALERNWDKLETAVIAPGPPPAVAPITFPGVLKKFNALLGLANIWEEDGEWGPERKAAVEAALAAVQQPGLSDSEVISALFELGDAKRGGKYKGIQAQNKKFDAAKAAANKVARSHVDNALRHLVYWISKLVLSDAKQRQKDGTLQFYDVLALARQLVSDPKLTFIREQLHAQYPYLLLDEFQDTDPIQIEIATRIAADPQIYHKNNPLPESWDQIQVTPGSLFMVGDPKQSIYRFRGADIATYLAAQNTFGQGNAKIELTENFRTTKPILDWVNTVFDELIKVDNDNKTQPEYTPLKAYRFLANADGSRGEVKYSPGSHPVIILGNDATSPTPEDPRSHRTKEAQEIADIIDMAVGKWSVTETVKRMVDGVELFEAETRTLKGSDVAILLPNRTSLGTLTDELTARNIPYRTEASSLVYQSEEVRALLMCARAVALLHHDPFTIVNALRTTLFGCGDDDLFRWKAAGFTFQYPYDAEKNQAAADKASLPVAEALRYLIKLGDQAQWLTPSEVLTRLITDRKMLEVAAFTPIRRDDIWRQLRFVVDQARMFEEATGGSLAQYCTWVAEQMDPKARVSESILPESDEDGASPVRIMTIYAAKGREFPMVILAGLNAPASDSGPRIFFPSAIADDAEDDTAADDDITDDDDTAAGDDAAGDDTEKPLYEFCVSDSGNTYTGGAKSLTSIATHHARAETKRLLYVGATRAQNFLVVSLYRKPGSASRAKTLDEARQALFQEKHKIATEEKSEALLAGGEALPRTVTAQKKRLADIAASIPMPKSLPGEYLYQGPVVRPATTQVAPIGQFIKPVSEAQWQKTHDAVVAAATLPGVVSPSRFKGKDTSAFETPIGGTGDELGNDGSGIIVPTAANKPGSKEGKGGAIGTATHNVLEALLRDRADAVKEGTLTLDDSRLTDLITQMAELESIESEALTRKVSDYVLAALAHPEIRKAAAQPHWQEFWVGVDADSEARKVIPAGVKLAQQGVLEGIIDLMYLDGDQLVIIDYKTDEVKTEADLNAKRAEHAPQQRAYVQMVQQATGHAKVKAKLLFLDAKPHAQLIEV